MKFKEEDLKKFDNSELIVNCESEELAVEFFRKLNELGYITGNGEKVYNPRWDMFKKKTCYFYREKEYLPSEMIDMLKVNPQIKVKNKVLVYGWIKVYEDRGIKIETFDGWEF